MRQFHHHSCSIGFNTLRWKYIKLIFYLQFTFCFTPVLEIFEKTLKNYVLKISLPIVKMHPLMYIVNDLDDIFEYLIFNKYRSHISRSRTWTKAEDIPGTTLMNFHLKYHSKWPLRISVFSFECDKTVNKVFQLNHFDNEFSLISFIFIINWL